MKNHSYFYGAIQNINGVPILPHVHGNSVSGNQLELLLVISLLIRSARSFSYVKVGLSVSEYRARKYTTDFRSILLYPNSY